MQCSYVTIVLKAFIMVCLIGHYPENHGFFIRWIMDSFSCRKQTEPPNFFLNKDWYVSILLHFLLFSQDTLNWITQKENRCIWARRFGSPKA